MHDSNGQFSFDLTQARSGNSLNPFIARAATTTATGSSPSATAAASGSNSEGGSDSAGGDTAGGDSGGDDHGGTKGRNILIAHGVLMCLAWVVFAPLGAIIVRAISGSKVVRMHYGTQILAYVLALTGTALGIYIAVKISAVGVYHPVIGLLVMGLATVQPVLGTIHHRIYKIKGQRTWWAVVHVWLGRVVITLAIINGGLGLLMAANTRAGEIVYGIFAGLIWLGWMAVAVWSEAKKATARESADGQKGDAEKVESS